MLHFVIIWLNSKRKPLATLEIIEIFANNLLFITLFLSILMLPSVACSVKNRAATTQYVVRSVLMMSCMWGVLLLYKYYILDSCSVQFMLHFACIQIVYNMYANLKVCKKVLLFDTVVMPILALGTIALPLVFLTRPCRLPHSFIVAFTIFGSNAVPLLAHFAGIFLKEMGKFYERVLF